MRAGASITIEPRLPGIPAFRIGQTIYVRPGLSRPVERWAVAHEAGHVAIGSPDYQEMTPHALDRDERRADRWGANQVAPWWRIVDAVLDGASWDDLCLEFGLTPEHMARVLRCYCGDQGVPQWT
jgi:hypothetical protein